MPKPAQALSLSTQDREILRLVRQGYRDGEIAGNLALSMDGVAARVRQIADKLAARDRLELAMIAARLDPGGSLLKHR
jgi:DNA-binding NarL/FixJ family response regulator